MFGFGDERISQLGAKYAERQNAYLHGSLADPHTSYSDKYPDVFDAFYVDANRNDWNINGAQFKLGAKNEDVIDAFLSAVPNPTHRKAISILLNQGNLADLQAMTIKKPVFEDAYHGGGDIMYLHDIPGAELFISRDEDTPEGSIVKHRNTRFTLNLSEDGKTAYLTADYENDVIAKAFDQNHPREIGTAVFSVRTTLDLSKEIPEVANVTFAQNFSDKLNQ